MIAKLFNSPPSADQTKQAVGVGTVGSSEAIMLAGLALKKKWQNKRKAQGKPFDKPNIVTGANVQVSSRQIGSASFTESNPFWPFLHRSVGRNSRGTLRWS